MQQKLEKRLGLVKSAASWQKNERQKGKQSETRKTLLTFG